MKVGFVGLGQMGAPMARNLVRAGHAVTVYNRTPARAEAFAAAEGGAGGEVRAVRSVAAVCDGAEVVVTMVADDAALVALALADGGIRDGLADGAVHVSMSTVGVEAVRRVGAAHGERGQRFVAAPVFGRPEAAAAAKLFVVAAGAADAVDAARPVLEAVGQRLFEVGVEPQQAAVVKLTGNFLLQSAVEGLGEAMALARRAGLEPRAYLDVLTSTLFTAPFYATYGGMIAADRYEPPGFALALALKDAGLVAAAAEAADVPMPAASLVRERLERAVARGMGGWDMAALGRLAAEDAGLA